MNKNVVHPMGLGTFTTPAATPLVSPKPLASRGGPQPPRAEALGEAVLRRHHLPDEDPGVATQLQALLASFPDSEPAPTLAFVRRRRPSQVPPPADPRAARPAQGAATDAGAPLPLLQRTEFEAIVGGKLPDVRLHTGQQAAATARSLSADAFAVGDDVYFGEGQFDPVNPSGRALLAHELTHVRQHHDGDANVQRAPQSPEGEHEALAIERQVRHGEAPAAQQVVIDRVVRRYTAGARPVGLELKERLDSLAERALQRARETLASQPAAVSEREVSRVVVPLTVNSASSDEQIIAAWASAIAAALRGTHNA